MSEGSTAVEAEDIISEEAAPVASQTDETVMSDMAAHVASQPEEIAVSEVVPVTQLNHSPAPIDSTVTMFQVTSPYDTISSSAELGEALFEELAAFLNELKEHANLDAAKQRDIEGKIARLQIYSSPTEKKQYSQFRSKEACEAYGTSMLCVFWLWPLCSDSLTLSFPSHAETVNKEVKMPWEPTFAFEAFPAYWLALCLSADQISGATAFALQRAKSRYKLLPVCRALPTKCRYGTTTKGFDKLLRSNQIKMLFFVCRVHLAMTLLGYDSFDDVVGGLFLEQKCAACFARMDEDIRLYFSTKPKPKRAASSHQSNRSEKRAKDERPSPVGSDDTLLVPNAARASALSSKGSTTSLLRAKLINEEISLPPAAKEVDFDILDPPVGPLVADGIQPACAHTKQLNSNDVLCLSSSVMVRLSERKIGTHRFFKLVSDFIPFYDIATIEEERLLSRTIVAIVRKRGGRFLVRKCLKLYEYGDAKAENITFKALRDYRSTPGVGTVANGCDTSSATRYAGSFNVAKPSFSSARHSTEVAGNGEENPSDAAATQGAAALLDFAVFAPKRKATPQGCDDALRRSAMGDGTSALHLLASAGLSLSEARSEPRGNSSRSVSADLDPRLDSTRSAIGPVSTNVSQCNDGNMPATGIAEEVGEVVGSETDLLTYFVGRVLTLQDQVLVVRQENQNLRAKHCRLAKELNDLRGMYHRDILKWTETACAPWSDDSAEGDGNPLSNDEYTYGPTKKFADVVTPVNVKDETFYNSFSSYSEDMSAQNNEIIYECGQLADEVKSWKKKYGDLMTLRQQLTVKAREFLQA